MTDISVEQLSSVENSLTERLKELHSSILDRTPGISRIACALYDPNTDLLKTFINSTHMGHAINRYEYPLFPHFLLSLFTLGKVSVKV